MDRYLPSERQRLRGLPACLFALRRKPRERLQLGSKHSILARFMLVKGGENYISGREDRKRSLCLRLRAQNTEYGKARLRKLAFRTQD